MKGKYIIAAGTAVLGLVAFYFVRNREAQTAAQPQKENERHQLTNAFAKAKQVVIGK